MNLNHNNRNASPPSSSSRRSNDRSGSEEKSTPPRQGQYHQARVIEIPVQHIKTTPSSSTTTTNNIPHNIPPPPHHHHPHHNRHPHQHHHSPGNSRLFRETSPFGPGVSTRLGASDDPFNTVQPPPPGFMADSDFFDQFDKNFDIGLDSPLTRRRRQQQQQQQNQQQPHDSRFPTLSSRFGNDEFFNRPFGAFPNPFVDQSSSPARDTASPQPTQPPIDPSLPKIYKTQANIYPEPSQTQTNPSGVPIRVEHVGGRSDFKYPETSSESGVNRPKVPQPGQETSKHSYFPPQHHSQSPSKMGNTMANNNPNSPNTSQNNNKETTPRKQSPGGDYTSSDFATAPQQPPPPPQQPPPSGPKTSAQKCDDIFAELTSLEQQVESFAGVKNDKLFLKLDELLTRCVLRLDEIERGDEQINQTRKRLINHAHKLADRLEEISTRNASAIVPVGPTDVVPAGANPPPQQPSISNLINQFEANRTSSSSSPKQSTS